MNSWRAITSHVILAGTPPVYFAYKLDFNLANSTSWTTVVIFGLAWTWIITRITIPILGSPLRHLPSPEGDTFPLGHRKILKDQPPTDQILNVCKEVPNDGLVTFWNPFYLRRQIIPTTPAAIMDVLNSHAYDWEKPSLAKKILSRTLGEGIIIVEGNTHKAMRKVVAPAFSGRHIRDLAPLFYSKGLALVETMALESREAPDNTLEMMNQMSRVTLDIIGAAGVGKDFNTINNDDDRLAHLYATITDTNKGSIILYVVVNLILPLWVILRLSGTVFARVANAQMELQQNIRSLLAEKKRDMAKDSDRHKDIIATIMRSGSFSDDYLSSQLLTFLAAGHDTTASALTWTTWLLSLNPDIQERLRKECQENLSEISTEAIDANTFDRMPYLTAVCNETLRLYPTVAVTARHAIVDTTITGIHIPKGSNVVISPWAINRLPSLWGDDANEYKPERWIEGPLAATGGAESPHAMITFLHGPRSCIGQSFAKMEMRCVLAALVMRFRFELADPDQEVVVGGFFTIKPKGGLRLKLHDLRSA